MSPSSTPEAWPEQLASCWIDTAEVLAAESKEADRPGRDSLGNPGRVLEVKTAGRLCVKWPRGRVVRQMQERGLRPVRDTAEETELSRAPLRETSEEIDPFLLEQSLVVTVRGRDFPGRQREIVESKIESLRREAQDASTSEQRRDAAEAMARELDEGLRSILDVRAVVRRFRPVVSVKDPVETIGSVVPLSAGARIVYSVNPMTPEKSDEGESEPMVFHLVAMGEREVVMLFTGGVHGQRHLRDLEDSRVHHAWFANRERAKTEATAPWIGRALLRDLLEKGRGEIVVHKRRDALPIAVEKTRDDRSTLSVDGQSVEVPVLVCRTSQDDELVVLNDPGSPLLLRLVERGAELVRTIEAVHSGRLEA